MLYRSKWFALVLVLATACGGDDGSDEGSSDECDAPTCGQAVLSCIDDRTGQMCRVGPGGCGILMPRPCQGGTTCQNGSCVTPTPTPTCPGGCCPECTLTTCGPESDDGCGSTCGSASSAAAMCEDVIRAICARVNPCCAEPGALCVWSGMSGCVDHYSLLWDCVGLWCDPAIDACMDELEDYTCGTRELPPACRLLANGTFEVLGEPATTPPPIDPPRDAGTAATMTCVGPARACRGVEPAACEQLDGCEVTPGTCVGPLSRCTGPSTRDTCMAESTFCFWTLCLGDARQCEQTPIDRCAASPGCMLQAQ